MCDTAKFVMATLHWKQMTSRDETTSEVIFVIKKLTKFLFVSIVVYKLTSR